MLEERRLDIVIYESLLKHIPPGRLPDESFDDETLVAAGVAALNEVYGETTLSAIVITCGCVLRHGIGVRFSLAVLPNGAPELHDYTYNTTRHLV